MGRHHPKPPRKPKTNPKINHPKSPQKNLPRHPLKLRFRRGMDVRAALGMHPFFVIAI